MGHLTHLFTTGRVEEVQTEAARMIADPNYAFFDFESELDVAGSNLLEGKRYEEAYFVYSMMSGFFPESARIWNRLGETQWNLGKAEEARSAFNKAIELDPDGEEGQKAKEHLLSLSEGE